MKYNDISFLKLFSSFPTCLIPHAFVFLFSFLEGGGALSEHGLSLCVSVLILKSRHVHLPNKYILNIFLYILEN